MNFRLTPNLDQFVRDQVESGDYNNASKVICDALGLLTCVNAQRASNLERLRAAIREGDAAIKRGEYKILNTDEELDALFAEF